MSEPLVVHVNRERLHSLDVPETFEVTGGFDVRLINHGEATHVHLHLDDSVSELASIDAPNHHLKQHSERRVGVTVSESGQARGNLKIVTGYGATTRYVALTVAEPTPVEQSVEVADELTKPQPIADDSDRPLLDRATAAAGLGLAVVASAGIAAVVGWTVAVAVLVVVLLIAVAVWQSQ